MDDKFRMKREFELKEGLYFVHGYYLSGWRENDIEELYRDQMILMRDSIQKSRNTWMIRTMIFARNFCNGQLNSLQNVGNNTEIKPLRRAANYSGGSHSGAFTKITGIQPNEIVI